MKQGEAPWFLMWCGPLLFTFALVWAWLVHICLAQIVTVLDMPVRSAFLVAAGALGTILGQSGMLWAWRRYVRATEEALAIDSTRRAARRDETKNRTGGTVPSADGHQDGEARLPGATPSP